MYARVVRRILALSAAAFFSAWASRASAVDPFEIQVYDGTSDPRGAGGLELHLNHVFSGHYEAVPPEQPLYGQTHMTLEPSYGLTDFWELGAYLQSAMMPDGTLKWAGAKLRSKFVTPNRNEGWRLGLNLEVSWIPSEFDQSTWGSELRPIVAWSGKGWLFAFNPIVDQALGAPVASDGPFFEPALKVARDVGTFCALGFEYYSSIGPVVKPLPWAEQEHTLYEVLDLLAFRDLELNMGIGEGLTRASQGITVKAIVGYTWDFSPSPCSDSAPNPETCRPPAEKAPGAQVVRNGVLTRRLVQPW
jgi:hypothetical protein